MTFTERLNYMNDLSDQTPAAPIRVVYPTSGMHVYAAIVTDPRIVIDYTLYCCSVATESEAHYLTGVLNAPILTTLVRPYMSYGKDERHVCKHVWKLIVPTYDPTDPRHTDISRLSRELTKLLKQRDLVSKNYVTVRQDFRSVVQQSGHGKELDKLVRELLGEPEESDSAAVPQTGLLRLTTNALELAADVEIDLDLEYDDERHTYLWGFLVTSNGRSTYTSIGSADAGFDEHELSKQLNDALTKIAHQAREQGQSCRIFHYGSAEPMFLRKLLGAHANELLDIATDLLTVIRDEYFSGVGYGLKRIASTTGFVWRTDGLTGADTLTLIARARTGDVGAWQTIIEYNEDDTRALHALRQFIQQPALSEAQP